VSPLTPEQIASREKTLLAALLLSIWAPLTTGIAVLLSNSTTQLADFVRRTVELVALAIAYGVFRYVERRGMPNDTERARLERTASHAVAVAMGISGLVMIVVAVSRLGTFAPGGNVYPGLAIGVMGLGVNAWFWRRYARLDREQHSPIIAAQGQLYRAKSLVDLCVIAALSAVAINPTHPVTRYIDIIGSLAVALYLLWSSLRAARDARPSALTRSRQKSHPDVV
jgi:divalent metal cation (Fe/Co/Zn/Cd) transporter